MKSFITALILLLLLIGTVTVNAIYIGSICDEIAGEAEDLSEGGYDGEKVSRLLDLWKKNESLMSLSVEADELKRMNDLISSLPTLKEKTSSDEFVRACLLITDLCDEFSSYERISFESIL